MKLIPAVLSALTFASVGYAQQSDICTTHTVASGETLRIIAEKYLGTREQSPIIYAANRATVGGNPNLITVGMQLNIPCASGETPTAMASAAPAAPATPEPAVEPTPVEIIAEAPAASTDSATRSLAPAPSFSGGFVAMLAEAPYAGPALDGGGIMPRLVTDAMDHAGVSTPPIGLSTLGSAATLDALASNAALEIGFPVIRPNCFSGNLSDVSRRLCNEFYFSSPMIEIVTALFGRTEDGLQVFSVEDLANKVVCIPDFYPIEELQDLGLALNQETMLEPGTVQACFDALWAKEVDLVYADFRAVEATAGDIEMGGQIEALNRFTWVKTIHAIAHNGNADGSESLTYINQGLAAMIFGKTWRGILMDLLS